MKAEILELERRASSLAEYHKDRRVTYPDEQTFWKFSRSARRYRRLMKDWWNLPAAALRSVPISTVRTGRDTWSSIPRKRAALIAQVQRTGRAIVVDGGCTYRFYPDARTPTGVYLFPENET